MRGLGGGYFEPAEVGFEGGGEGGQQQEEGRQEEEVVFDPTVGRLFKNQDSLPRLPIPDLEFCIFFSFLIFLFVFVLPCYVLFCFVLLYLFFFFLIFVI